MRPLRPTLVALVLLAAAPAAQAASLHLAFQHPAETVGPQKEADVPINITNLEGRRVEVRFQVVDGPSGGRWALILPEPAVIEPGQTQTVVAMVSTDFHNGYVKGDARWMVRATPYAPGTQEPAGEPADLEIGQPVRGWYVPGPSIPLSFTAMGLASFAARRRLG